MKKHAILLLAHDQLSHLIDLINLFNDNFIFFIHLDKSGQYKEEDILRIKNFKNVQLIEKKYKIKWGGYSIVKGFIWLAKQIPFIENYTYIHLMSGHDLPLLPPEEILVYFEKNKGKQFLHHFKLPSDNWGENGGLDRLKYYHFYDQFNGKNKFGFLLIRILIRLQKILGLKRDLSKINLKLFGGSCWCSLTGPCFKFCIDYLKSHPGYLKSMKYTFAPDELFFHTLVMNSPYKSNVVNDNLYFIEWGNSPSSSPEILTEDHIQKVSKSGKLFARKITLPYSNRLKAKFKKNQNRVK